jgi:diguanylate cyclase (GGDEF)-like protein
VGVKDGFSDTRASRSRAQPGSAVTVRPGQRRLSVRAKLMAMAFVASGLIFAVLLVAVHGFSRAAAAYDLALRLRVVADVSTGLDAGRHAAFAAASEAMSAGRATGAGEELQGMVEETRKREGRVEPDGLPNDVLQALTEQEVAVDAVFDSAAAILLLAVSDRPTAQHELRELQELDTRLEESQTRLDQTVSQAASEATGRAQRIQQQARDLMLVTAAFAVLALFTFCYAVGRFIIRSLGRLAAAAAAIAAGELDTRSGVASGDEIGAVGHALDTMADNLQDLLAEMGEEARRDLFKSQLVEAFELTDNEQEAHQQVAITMTHIDENLPMQLLLSDSSRAHLSAAVVHPVAGSPGCGVQTPYSCLAVRRGRVVVTGSSNELNACPKLRGRESGSCSAVCVPVTFMGRALGVLHVTGPDDVPPDGEQIVRLTALAGQTGTTIGTIRATQVTQLQAMTDGLTGLINRRTLENDLRELLESGVSFSLAMADVDHFKIVNDTYGHDAGDRALRLLTGVFRSSIGAQDFAGRYGGEEFVLVFPGLPVTDAKDTLEHVRAQLAEALQSAAVPSFTVSFGVTDSSTGNTLDEIIRHADGALSTAKRDGRDRVVVASNRSSYQYRNLSSEIPGPRSPASEPSEAVSSTIDAEAESPR